MNFMLSRSVGTAVAGMILCAATASFAQDTAKKGSPSVIFASSLAVTPGQTVTLQLRGLKLDAAERVEASGAEPPVEISLKKKEKAGVPNQMTPEQVGDTLVEIEVKIPEGFSAAEIPLVVHTPSGAAPPYRLLVIPKVQQVAETEPNDGFKQPQIVEAGKTVIGVIQPKDPDVFQITGKTGQKLTAEVIARRQGSPVDGIISIFDFAGRLLVACDDTSEGTDPVASITLPADAAYLIVVQDAHDRGGNTHPYLFRAKLE